MPKFNVKCAICDAPIERIIPSKYGQYACNTAHAGQLRRRLRVATQADPALRRAAIVEYFWKTVDKGPGQGPKGDCWEWSTAPERGEPHNLFRNEYYGKFGKKVDGRMFGRPYQFSYYLHYGPLPAGLVVMHLCDNQPCVRPGHLQAGTHAENLAMTAGKKKWSYERDTAQERCKHFWVCGYCGLHRDIHIGKCTAPRQPEMVYQ